MSFNQRVLGSNPSAPTNNLKDLCIVFDCPSAASRIYRNGIATSCTRKAPREGGARVGILGGAGLGSEKPLNVSPNYSQPLVVPIDEVCTFVVALGSQHDVELGDDAPRCRARVLTSGATIFLSWRPNARFRFLALSGH